MIFQKNEFEEGKLLNLFMMSNLLVKAGFGREILSGRDANANCREKGPGAFCSGLERECMRSKDDVSHQTKKLEKLFNSSTWNFLEKSLKKASFL